MTYTNYGQPARGVGTIPRMNDKQDALAAVIRAEAAAQRITAKQLQDQVGISSSAYSNYFVKCTRDVPMSVVVAIAEVLGMTGSELLRRAEARAAGSPSVDRTTRELEASLSPADRDLLNRLRAEQAKTGEAMRDPSGRARADQDDGIGRSATQWRRTA